MSRPRDRQTGKPYKLIWFGDIHGPKPHKSIWFCDMHPPKPSKFLGVGVGTSILWFATQVSWSANPPERGFKPVHTGMPRLRADISNRRPLCRAPRSAIEKRARDDPRVLRAVLAHLPVANGDPRLLEVVHYSLFFENCRVLPV